MYTLALAHIVAADIGLVGGKTLALASLHASGERVPSSLCITTGAYNAFVDECGIREKIALELNRKNFSEMRWEEIWDTALRIRRLFVNASMPQKMTESLAGSIEAVFGNNPVAIRSSSPEEDSARASFAGLHESFINVTGTDAVIEHIKKVWASLWSDAALLYRQENDLAPQKSSIAVLIQEVIASDVSGVMFSRSPEDDSLTIIEAVYGLNQGLVDGTIEPDRWLVRIRDRKIVSHHQAERVRKIIPINQGTGTVDLAEEKQNPPLASERILHLADRALQIETHFGTAQDIEWTFAGPNLYILQSRPVTIGAVPGGDDKRSWYLSLRRSFENLKSLQKRIGDELLPGMDAEARAMGKVDIHPLDDKTLAGEIRHRIEIHARWVDTYWAEFIPFAHGMRLFGQIYNDRIKPDDPYEFVSLLSTNSLASIRRNRLLLKLGRIASQNVEIRSILAENRPENIGDQEFVQAFTELRELYGEMHLSLGSGQKSTGSAELACSLILKMAEKGISSANEHIDTAREKLEENFFAHFPDPTEKEKAVELLELGRASYTFRDDDNIYLGRIEQQLNRVLEEAYARLQARHVEKPASLDNETIVKCLEDPSFVPENKAPAESRLIPLTDMEKKRGRARQLIGQPAGPGIARGKARVVTEPFHLQDFEQGEILVCDSIDPNMTFIVPLTAGIVERRGGMLIHGAIIAREYGIACVTGIPEATNLIRTGDSVTVDGYLGIVTISHAHDPLA